MAHGIQVTSEDIFEFSWDLNPELRDPDIDMISLFQIWAAPDLDALFYPNLTCASLKRFSERYEVDPRLWSEKKPTGRGTSVEHEGSAIGPGLWKSSARPIIWTVDVYVRVLPFTRTYTRARPHAHTHT
jgi:hypothetical protein